MTVTRYQIGRSPFNPLTSFLAYATGDEEITLKASARHPPGGQIQKVKPRRTER